MRRIRGFAVRRGGLSSRIRAAALESSTSDDSSSDGLSDQSSRESLSVASSSAAASPASISLPDGLSSDSSASEVEAEEGSNNPGNNDNDSSSNSSIASISISSGSLGNLSVLGDSDQEEEIARATQAQNLNIEAAAEPRGPLDSFLARFAVPGSSLPAAIGSRRLDDILLSFPSDSSDDDDDVLNRFHGLVQFSPPRGRVSDESADSSLGADFVERAFGEFNRSFAGGIDSAGNSPAQTSASTSSAENRPASAGTSTATMSAPTSGGSISFECNVCLESLDGPASIDVDAPRAPQNCNVDVALVDALTGWFGGGHPRNTARMSTGGHDRSPATAATRGRGRRRTANSNENVSLTDVVATSCGHLYHQVCLLKWFTQQGRRSCPSCRKSVPSSKLIRLYPSSTASTAGDGGGRPTQGMPLSANGNESGPSAASSTNANPNSNGTCGNANCQDLKDIHNTLINDYTELQERYTNLRENEGLKDAQISSLEEDNTRKEEEIVKLKRELEEIRDRATASTSTGAKRRRR